MKSGYSSVVAKNVRANISVIIVLLIRVHVYVFFSRFVFTIELARRLVTTDFESVRSNMKKMLHTKFEEDSASVLVTVDELQREYAMLNIRSDGPRLPLSVTL